MCPPVPMRAAATAAQLNHVWTLHGTRPLEHNRVKIPGCLGGTKYIWLSLPNVVGILYVFHFNCHQTLYIFLLLKRFQS